MTMPYLRRTPARAGTLLILVAGIAALMLSMAMAFLIRMRSSAEESAIVVRETSAHIMLVAACNYIQETSRMGWDDPSTPDVHEETFGWIDVRDGTPGPKDQNGNQLSVMRGMWVDLTLAPEARPAARCPMYRMHRPPYAINPVAAPNPIATIGPYQGMPLVANPDPLPAVHAFVANVAATQVAASEWEAYKDGDKRPVQAQNPTWFRVFRDGPASFVVTCGCGGTFGFKDFNKMTSAEQSIFNGDRSLFDAIYAEEIRLFYRVEWTAAVATPDYYNINNDFTPAPGSNSDHYFQSSMDASMGVRNQPHNVNMVGTIRYIQRLLQEPTYW